jgi:hypothetical protein
MLDKGAAPEEARELRSILRKCTEMIPTRRFQSAAELRRALEGFYEARAIARSLPKPGALVQAAARHPILALMFCALLPQWLGSFINISYNSLRIVSQLSPAQHETFRALVFIYNGVVYPLCTLVLLRLLLPIARFYSHRREIEDRGPEALHPLRQHVLGLPLRLVALTTLGWLPGSLFFPLGLDWWSGPIPHAAYGHFLISFALSWLIALTYSYVFVQFLILRIIYPMLWVGTHGIRKTAYRELSASTPRLRVFHLLAGFIPLLAAALIVFVGPDSTEHTQYLIFERLVASLIGLGMVGIVFALKATNLLSQTLFALTGSEPSARS